MARYFLHIIRFDDLIRDIEGSNFLTPLGAREEAIRAFREIMAENMRFAKNDGISRIVIADENDVEVDVVTLSDVLPDPLKPG